MRGEAAESLDQPFSLAGVQGSGKTPPVVAVDRQEYLNQFMNKSSASPTDSLRGEMVAQ